MIFCPNCGTQVEENNMTCIECGVEVSLMTPKNENSIPNQTTNIAVLDDDAVYNGIFLLVILGMLLPLIGIILYFIWRKAHPIKARAVGIGALLPISIISFYFIYVI